MSARAAQGTHGTSMMFDTKTMLKARGRLALALAVSSALVAAAPARAGETAPAPAAQKDDALTPPPVVDPKSVATQPVAPAPAAPFAPPEELTLAPVPVLTLSGTATWEEAYDKLVDAMKTLDKELTRLGLTRGGDVLVVYTSSDDRGFEFEAQLPFSGTTTQKPGGAMKLGGSYAGKVLKFTHSGSFADMDNTYEQIANYLDEKNVNADELYVERYRTDLVTTAPDALKIDILVPAPK
ncbi:GyrI-like domain-containing protein [Xanthobacter agilis]|uniref:Effector-binding domain-containing protein n=1 Tax=Xanthobacter agilis TaxID=47492 RepID=A0ABU0LFH7_XANAG|nr:GyrI-like domain-containing protein [Xanthobacter agilis]MDQ0505895.1 effector-binding domain-containing protein [Xanthobacter agilis]